MKKIVISRSDGGCFHLSMTALAWLMRKGVNTDPWGENIARDNKFLVECVETLGTRAGSNHSELEIIEIPDDVDFIIEEYDGKEWVSEKHRTWGK